MEAYPSGWQEALVHSFRGRRMGIEADMLIRYVRYVRDFGVCKEEPLRRYGVNCGCVASRQVL